MKLYSQKMGSGDPFIILHGLFGSSDNWFTIAKQLSEYFTIHLIDARNHGKSPHTDQFGYENMARDVREYMADHNLKDVILMGHSMGGKTAMKIALEYPMRVSELLIADIAPRKYAIVHNRIVETLLSIKPGSLQSREQADKQLAESINSSAVRRFLLKNLNRNENNQFEWQINLKAICHNLDELGAQITSSNKYEKDVLFLKGEFSEYITPDDEVEIISLFPNAQIVSIPRSTHWLHAENPDAFLNEINKFLQIDS